MSLRVVRLGTPRLRGEGLRLGTVRRPPRGVRKEDYAALDYYDVWLPGLAPSAVGIVGIVGAVHSAALGDLRAPLPRRDAAAVGAAPARAGRGAVGADEHLRRLLRG